ncbi:MAG: sigma-70 family RNA polymerase sigma factor [Propionibacteriaceae bacterium]|nr:sigma-70 family RNA polymerase sigma factor [Propionibacteriaceae bacterium]
MLKRVISEQLLSAAEEVELARAIEAGVLAKAVMDGQSGLSVCASGEELVRLVRGGGRAWRRFLLANVRLVSMIAYREAKRGRLDVEELFQEGFVALADSLCRFDYRRGRFTTYAFPRVRQRVATVACSRMGEFPIPPSLALRRMRVIGLSGLLEQELLSSAVFEQVSLELGQDRQWVRRLLSYGPTLPLSDVENPAGCAVAQQVDFENGLRRQALDRCLARLAHIEREVVRLRFGFDRAEPLSLVAVAKQLGLSASGVRRIELRALEKLRFRLDDGESLAG